MSCRMCGEATTAVLLSHGLWRSKIITSTLNTYLELQSRSAHAPASPGDVRRCDRDDPAARAKGNYRRFRPRAFGAPGATVRALRRVRNWMRSAPGSWNSAPWPSGASYGRSRKRGRSSDSQRRPARQWQIRASSERRGSGAKPATSRSAIAAARPANGGQGRRASSWPRTNIAHAAPISAASAASRWVAHATWFAHC